MNRTATFISFLLILILSIGLTAQNLVDPVFSAFTGKMFKIPVIKKKTEYGFKLGS